MDILISAARWLAFLPSALGAYVVTTWLVFYGVSYGAPEAASAVRYAADFAGYYLLGPAIVFIRKKHICTEPFLCSFKII
jgi:hypothetical protein